MRRPICEDDLHAWADGRLEPGRRAEVEAWLAEDPQRRARVEAWRGDSARLRATFDPVLDEPVPARLRALVERPRRAGRARAAAVVAWVTLGAIVGAVGGYRAGQPDPVMTAAGLSALPRQAALAHAVYSPEVRHPVEVTADDEAHLVAWLSKRLGAPVRVPELAAHGYALLGGRLLPGASGPGAQFMYEDDAGRRLTLYVSVTDASPDATTAFRFAQEDRLSTFYWVDGRFGYALSGELPRDALLPLANAAYHQLSP